MPVARTGVSVAATRSDCFCGVQDLRLFIHVSTPFGEWVSPAVSGTPETPRGSTNGEAASHPGGCVSRHRAEVAVLALFLERVDKLRGLTGTDQRGLLAGDLEVVRDVADVLE